MSKKKSKKSKSASKKELLAMLNREHDSWSLSLSFEQDISEILVYDESAEDRLQRIQSRLNRFKYAQGKLSAT